MSDTPAPQGVDPIVAPAAPVIQPVSPVVTAPVIPPVPPLGETKVDMTPAQLKARLDEERSKAERKALDNVMSQLGIPIDEAKKLIADAKAKDDAQKSEVQRLAEQKAALEKQLEQFGPYRQAVEGRAALEYASLTPEQKAAVDALAGDDPAAKLRTIDTLRPTWAAANAAAQAAAQAATEKANADAAKAAEDAAKKAPLPAPASTTPAIPPPAPVAPGQPTNHFAVWQALKVSNPAGAAVYHTQHESAIRAARHQATG